VPAQREWLEKDYYRVLGVPESATESEIRKAYRRLAKEHHPDAKGRANGSAGSDDRFKEINAAYDVLSDQARRKEYDELRRLGPAAAGGFGGPFGPSGGPRPGGGTTFTFDGGDLGDMLGGLFGRFRGPGPGAPAGGPRAGGQRGEDLEAELHLSFTDAVEGVTTSVNVTSEAVCATCHGSGAAAGTSPTTCPECGGRGVVDDDQGLFSFSRACARCGGRGVVVEHPCPTCRGRGVEVRPRQVRVRVPAGVADGQRIRLKGRGGPGRGGGPPGDLFVVVRVASHERFGRQGRHLTVTVPVSYPEAVLGAEIEVPTLDRPVTLRVPPGTRSGRRFRVRGRGVPTARGTGDLLVTVEVSVPTSLSDAQREAVEALRAALEHGPGAGPGAGAGPGDGATETRKGARS